MNEKTRRKVLQALGSSAIGATLPLSNISRAVQVSATIECGETHQGELNEQDEVHYPCGIDVGSGYYEPISFSAQAGCEITVTMERLSEPEPEEYYNIYIGIENQAGELVATNSYTYVDDENPETLEYELNTGGEYIIRAGSACSPGDEVFPYEISLSCSCSGPSLSLELTGDTIEPGGTAVVEYVLTNTGGNVATAIEGNLNLPSDNWQLGGSGSFTSLEPGESESVSVAVLVPENASGEYTIDGSVTDDADNEASASATITVEEAGEPEFEITAQSTTGAVAPGETTQLFPAISNTGDSSGDPSAYFQPATESTSHNADYYGDEFTVVTHDDDGGDWQFEAWAWEDVGPGETREPSIELRVAETVEPGEYTFRIEVLTGGSSDDTATATITVGQDNTPPNAAFTIAPENPTVGDTLTFDASGSNDPDGTIEIYEWKVGDGDTFTPEGSEFTAELSEVGEMTVTLRVTDNDSATDSITKTITVTDTVSITDMKPVQIVANSRLEPPAQSSPGGSSASEFPTYPPLIPGKGTGVVFDLEQDTLDAIPDGASVVVNCTADGEYSDLSRLQYTKSELAEIADRPMLGGAFDESTLNIPSVELPPDGQRSITLRIALATDQGEPIDPPLVEETITEDLDFTCREPDEIRVGVAQLENPDPNSSQPYGDVDKFEETVEEIEEALRNRFPTREEKITVKSTPDPVSGILPTGLPTPEGINVNLVVICVDQANGYDKLISEFPSSDFDATLLIVPDGYFQENGYSDISGIHIGAGVVQPQFAAMAEEGRRPSDTADTALHELGHHFLPTDFYPDKIAQRREGGQIDNDHARTQFRDVDDDDSPEDTPGVVSAAFSVNISSGQQLSTDAPGTMTYEDGDPVPDTLMYEKLLEGLEPRPPTAQLVDDGSRLVLSVIALIVDEGIEIITESTYQGYPMPDVPDGDVTVTIRDANENQINQQTAPVGLTYHPTTAGSGAPSELTLEPAYRMSVPISEEAEEVEFKHEAGATETVSLSESTDEPAPDDSEDNETTGGDGNGSDGFGSGFGVGGALAGLGGAGYLLKRRLNDEDSE